MQARCASPSAGALPRQRRRWPAAGALVAYLGLSVLAAVSKTVIQSPVATPGKNTLLVIAHPDDETMFFSPTVTALHAEHAHVFVLCLSTGNAYGKGSERCDELRRACQVLQITPEQVKCSNNSDLQDGLNTVWPSEAVQKEVRAAVDTWSIDTIVTFDALGVSGHANHGGVFQGTRDYLRWRELERLDPLPAWSLVSTNMVRKYLGILDLLPSATLGGSSQLLTVNTLPYRTVWAMLQHRTQLVWYRYLFITFSRYTWVNTLQPLESRHLQGISQTISTY